MSGIGSEWHIWDLHFHTPSSYDYKNKNVTNEDIINKLSEEKVAVVAITDHHNIDIQRITSLQKLGKEANVVVLPGIEFLCETIGKAPVHFIGIFHENCNLQMVWEQIKNKTNIEKIEKENEKINEVYCQFDSTVKLVHELGGIISIHAGQKHGSVEMITNSLPHSMAQKKHIAQKVNIYELGQESDQDGYKNVVFPAIKKVIPMIICSDNHNIEKYHIKQKLWIKGKPGFDSLKYALNEPEERFYIGEEPEVKARVRKNKTKYIKSLEVKRVGQYDNKNIFFEDVKIPLNPELVSIIGHKGSGKSAVADIIALCGNGEHSDKFQFLNQKKFKKRGLADRFEARYQTYNSTFSNAKKLIEDIEVHEPPSVRYLPQSYFELICNEVSETIAFKQEIEKVVFQYIPAEKKLSKSSFIELVDYKSEVIDQEIEKETVKIAEVNKEIIKIEDLLNPSVLDNLKAKRELKKQELEAHIRAKPEEVIDPNIGESAKKKSQFQRQIEGLKSEKENLENEIQAVKLEIRSNLENSEVLSRIKREITERVGELRNLIIERKDIAIELGVDLEKVLSVQFNETLINNCILEVDTKLKELQNKVSVNQEIKSDSSSDEPNLAERLISVSKQIEEVSKRLTQNERNYNNYCAKLKEWSETKDEIEGSELQEGSLRYLDSRIKYIGETALTDLNILRGKRIELSKSIFNKKMEIKQLYDSVKLEIDKKLQDSEVEGLEINSEFNLDSNFIDKVMTYIRNNISGTFYGKDSAKKYLAEELLEHVEWNDFEQVKKFLNSIIESLEKDMRSDEIDRPNTFIGSLVSDRADFYSYLFNLKYLVPYYDLKQDNKSLEQLSPGEKGALLLIFYLALDNDRVPLLIDQPEDNLDNNSVARVLVPFIRKAKKYRQIIMVTHNPNLAVVSDSEQIIKVEIEKDSGNSFSYISGGIEEKHIRDEIIDVLEGTLPAFSKRKDKYKFSTL